MFMNQTSAAFHSVMGLRVIKGRWFAVNEPGPVVVLNETLAKVMFDETIRGTPGRGFRNRRPTPERDPNPVAATAATVSSCRVRICATPLDEDPVPGVLHSA